MLWPAMPSRSIGSCPRTFSNRDVEASPQGDTATSACAAMERSAACDTGRHRHTSGSSESALGTSLSTSAWLSSGGDGLRTVWSTEASRWAGWYLQKNASRNGTYRRQMTSQDERGMRYFTIQVHCPMLNIVRRALRSLAKSAARELQNTKNSLKCILLNRHKWECLIQTCLPVQPAVAVRIHKTQLLPF